VIVPQLALRTFGPNKAASLCCSIACIRHGLPIICRKQVRQVDNFCSFFDLDHHRSGEINSFFFFFFGSSDGSGVWTWPLPRIFVEHPTYGRIYCSWLVQNEVKIIEIEKPPNGNHEWCSVGAIKRAKFHDIIAHTEQQGTLGKVLKLRN
jgi:hypothetical protein